MADNNNSDAEAAFSSNSRDAASPTGVYVKWIALILVIAAAVGFFGIKPGLEGYFSNNTKTTEQLAQNISNQQRKSELEQQFKGLDATRSKVTAFLDSFPQSADQKRMVDELQGIASKNGVSISNITPTTPAVIGPDGKPAVAAPAPVTAPDGSNTPAVPQASAPSGSLLGTIGLTIVVQGDNINGFITDLEKAKRVFMIDSLNYTDDGKGAKQVSIVMSTYIVSPIKEPTPPQTNK
jgi:hypothetical protein